MKVPPDVRCWAEIDLGAVRHNLHYLLTLVAPQVKLMAVVKANAYGHGLAEVVTTLAPEVAMFGTANVHEAEIVRATAPQVPVLILGPSLPGEREAVVRGGFEPSVSTVEEARAYGRLAQAVGTVARIHVVLDTGMGRIGVWQDEVAATLPQIAALPGVQIVGLRSHLPVADEDEAFTTEQLARFHRLVDAYTPPAGVAAPLRHIENSAGVLGFGSQAGDLVRLGLALYGSAPLPEHQPALRPSLAWKTRISLVREVGAGRTISYGRTFTTPHAMRIATLAAGYADGIPRHLTASGFEVLIGGRRCALLGRVTMDQILVDISAVPEAQEGDEAVLLGRQGEEEILAAEMAAKAGTIAWEILTGLGPRVQRFYRQP